MEAWNAKIDMKKKHLEVYNNGESKPKKIFAPIEGSHLKIGLQPLLEHTDKTSVLYLQKTAERKKEHLVHHVEAEEVTVHLAQETMSFEYVDKFHRGSGHKSFKNMMHALSQADMVTPETRKVVKAVVDKCKVCKKFRKSFPRPKTTLPKVSETN